MEVVRSLAGWSGPEHAAVTVGAYDGLHPGHHSVMDRLHAEARERGLPTALVTFDRHPGSVLRPDEAPLLLTDPDQKLELIEAAGIDYAVVLTFDHSVARQSAEEFAQRVLVAGLGARIVVVGTDFRFGRGRDGGVGTLSEIGARHGFEVVGVELLADEDHPGDKVSSSAIRAAISTGDVAAAATMLGRPHEVRGPVVEGDQRGRTIGFPTANVNVANTMVLPADAVYAGWYVRPDGERYMSAINLGRRPTFYENADVSLLEAFLLDFSGDLYGEVGRVQFVDQLRGEVKFDGLDELKAQLARDVDDVRALLSDRA